ncbi:GAF domain-containing protein [Janibacter alkaliphilus]|uniref:GAF domain-containing protein n=1 Tax=Janibacter alkaliphilus TaxID=1069963 RepID=A0A852XBB5_9MICO|nr:GAF domain-containing protein [Janibacter alkaliphilus]NYG35775.1 hypothetical protein [Janibacter alkaliphilus]
MSITASDHGAVAPGTDLRLRAHELRSMHDAVLSGSRPAQHPRALVSRSWQRVLAAGLPADRSGEREPTPFAEVERRRHDSPLHLVIDELRRVLTSVADASHFLMVVTDPDGVVLWREGSAAVRHQADRLGFLEGAVWTETQVGTNAIGTALAEGCPVELFSAEHFQQAQHPWYCSAWPMHDPRTGQLLGVVDVSGPALTLHPAIRALVESAVRLARARLVELHREQLSRLRRRTEPLLAGGHGPVLVVDDEGWVAHHRGMAAPERVEAPAGDRCLLVPGLGRCRPERLDVGWVLRPEASGQRVVAHLHRGTGRLQVVSGEGDWQVVLSRRRTDLLSCLAGAGEDGLSAAQLSLAVYGDTTHVVTVRAEVSRLRRQVGGLVASSPYRVAAGVTLSTTG